MAEASLMGSRDAKNWPAEGCRPGRGTPAGRPLVSRDVRSEDREKKSWLHLGQTHTLRADLFLSSPSPPIPFSWSEVLKDPCLHPNSFPDSGQGEMHKMFLSHMSLSTQIAR